MKKQMNIGGLVVAAQILGIPGAFAGPWEDGMAAYNRGDYVPELRVLIRPSLQDAPNWRVLQRSPQRNASDM